MHNLNKFFMMCETWGEMIQRGYMFFNYNYYYQKVNHNSSFHYWDGMDEVQWYKMVKYVFLKPVYLWFT